MSDIDPGKSDTASASADKALNADDTIEPVDASTIDLLAARVQSGDVDALAEYLEYKRPQLTAFVRRRLGAALQTKVEPLDIVQDASLEAVKTLTPEWPGDRDPFSWLCQLAERKIVDAHRFHVASKKRSAKREQPLQSPSGGEGEGGGLIDMLVNSMTSPSAAFSRNAKELRLQTALLTLKEDEREAIRLRYVENWQSKQIAEELGKSDAAVRVLLSRTIKRLQNVLDTDTSIGG